MEKDEVSHAPVGQEGEKRRVGNEHEVPEDGLIGTYFSELLDLGKSLRQKTGAGREHSP